jgi:futalosine hydrolase
MKILIASATVAEIRPLLKRMNEGPVSGDRLLQYTYHGHSVDVLISGVGMAHTAYHVGAQLSKEKYDLALNAGIAGAYSPSVKIGDVYRVDSEIFGLMGIEDEENYLSLFDLGLMDPDSFPYSGGWLVNPTVHTSRVLCGLPPARGVTVNMIYTHPDTISVLNEIYRADLESMEGASFFYACLNEKVPFAQIRSVSNYVAVRDKSHWDIPLAVRNLDKTLGKLLDELARSSSK